MMPQFFKGMTNAVHLKAKIQVLPCLPSYITDMNLKYTRYLAELFHFNYKRKCTLRNASGLVEGKQLGSMQNVNLYNYNKKLFILCGLLVLAFIEALSKLMWWEKVTLTSKILHCSPFWARCYSTCSSSSLTWRTKAIFSRWFLNWFSPITRALLSEHATLEQTDRQSKHFLHVSIFIA